MIKRALLIIATTMVVAAKAVSQDAVEDAAWNERLTLAAEPTMYGCRQRDMLWFYGLEKVVADDVKAKAGADPIARARGEGMIAGARVGADFFAAHFKNFHPCSTLVNFLALEEFDARVVAAEKTLSTEPPPPGYGTQIPTALTDYASFGQIVGMRLNCLQRSEAWASRARARLAPDVAGQAAFPSGTLDATDTAYLKGYEAMSERFGKWEASVAGDALCASSDSFPNAALVDKLAAQ